MIVAWITNSRITAMIPIQGLVPPTLSQSSTAIWIVAVSYSDKPRCKIQQFHQIAVVTEIGA